MDFFISAQTLKRETVKRGEIENSKNIMMKPFSVQKSKYILNIVVLFGVISERSTQETCTI